MDEHGDEVEAVHIVTQQIHHLSRCRVSECVLRQLSRLPVNDATHGDPDSHARDEALIDELVRVERTEQTDADDSAGSEPRIVLGQVLVILAEELQEAAEQEGLENAHDFAQDCDHSDLCVLAPEREDDGLDETWRSRGTVLQLDLPFSVE